MRFAPGGPFLMERDIPHSIMTVLNQKYGTDAPLYVQLYEYINAIIFHFDFGPSMYYKKVNVTDIIVQAFPITLTYGFWAFCCSVTIGVTSGIISAVYKDSWFDRIAVASTTFFQVIPNFVIGPVMVLIFSYQLTWLPSMGWKDGQIEYMIMPIITLAAGYVSNITRLTRVALIEVLSSDYIRSALAKGMPKHIIIFRHATKPTLLPVISYLAPTFVAMITGSMVVDVIFRTGGIGYHFIESALQRDYILMMGITLLMGVLIILFNAIADIIYSILDPKVNLNG